MRQGAVTAAMPALFLSHGAPDFPARPSAAREVLGCLGATLPRPAAILIATAHWETAAPTLGAAGHPATLNDFEGFDWRVRRRRYAAPGAPDVAAEAAALLAAAGFTPRRDASRGLDQAIWGPLSVLYPEADIPVVPLSVQPFADAAHHLAVGRALKPLRRQGVLIIGTGALTHDTRHMAAEPDIPAECPRAARFAAWLGQALAAGNTEALLAWEEGPNACTSHATAEHLWPLFVAYGAAEGPGTCLHASVQHATVAMQVWRFDGGSAGADAPAIGPGAFSPS